MAAIYIARSKEIAARRLDDEMLIMSARDSTLFSLNEVGAAIWEAADGQTPLHQIVEQRVCAEFDVEPAQALQDAEEFVRELAGHGILVLSAKPLGEKEGPGSKEQEARSAGGEIDNARTASG